MDDPRESNNLYSNKKYRKQLKQQLKIMLASAEKLDDTLTIKLAKKELAILNQHGKYEYTLY